MADINASVDNAEVMLELQRLNRAVSNMQPVFNDIGNVIKTEIENTFTDQKSPDGINWKPLSPVTIARRHNHSNVPLNDTGKLKNSFTYIATNNSVKIGANVPYAAMMNYGGSRTTFRHLWGDIPARPFLPSKELPQIWQDEIQAIVLSHIGNIKNKSSSSIFNTIKNFIKNLF